MSFERYATSTRLRTHYGPRPKPYRLVVALLNSTVRLLYSWQSYGHDSLPDARSPSDESSYILAVKHGAIMDIFVAGLTVKRPMTWMIKAPLSRWRLIDAAFYYLGAVPVIRQQDRPYRVYRGLEPDVAIDAMIQPVKEGFPAVVFCEGTRLADPREVGEIKTGIIRLALRTGQKIYPVGLAGTHGKAYRDRLGRRQAVAVFGPPLNPSMYPGTEESRIQQVRLDLRLAMQNATDQAWILLEQQ